LPNHRYMLLTSHHKFPPNAAILTHSTSKWQHASSSFHQDAAWLVTKHLPAGHGRCSVGKWGGRSPGTQILSVISSLRQGRRD